MGGTVSEPGFDKDMMAAGGKAPGALLAAPLNGWFDALFQSFHCVFCLLSAHLAMTVTVDEPFCLMKFVVIVISWNSWF